MPDSAFYKTAAWRQLRQQRLDHDHGTCTVPGCTEKAIVVDHVNSSERGRVVPIARLRSLCRVHDNQVKEDQHGKRRSGGQFTVSGNDASGWPIDPNHPWNRQ